MSEFAPTPRSTVVRSRPRACYDVATVHTILDEAHFCTVAFVDGGQPVAIPINHWRIGEVMYFHGAPASRLMKALCSGAEVCVSATLVDGLVLARSAARHSMNYRSVVIFGRGREIVDPKEKRAALASFVDHLVPGRAAEVRAPTAGQLAGTAVAALSLIEASAKVRTGGPNDEEADRALPVWAGVVPLRLTAGVPEPITGLDPSISLPAALSTGGRTD
ncbi:MAG: pyridoxamine 5'-phosphate oxidase family protein [Rhodospirillales bacterium]|jgi:nitroimidazol reductase NimA-like FMN-containing flavoprotein (pyridoxamine 5'-phosphate oxidase superfamily)|nr:pyridoxamine 5'-phosphate oxidase family protein [Rhodospirillales bacterium]